jgi:FtsH-binding integral membrane protein
MSFCIGKITALGSLSLSTAVMQLFWQSSPGIIVAIMPVFIVFFYRPKWLKMMYAAALTPISRQFEKFLPSSLPAGYYADGQLADEFHTGSIAAIAVGLFYVVIMLAFSSSIELSRRVARHSIDLFRLLQKLI